MMDRVVSIGCMMGRVVYIVMMGEWCTQCDFRRAAYMV